MKKINRRSFLKAVGATGVVAGVANLLFMDNSLVADPISSTERDLSSPSVARDLSLCIGCGNCVQVCTEVQKIGALALFRESDPARGREYYANTVRELPLAESDCINCGQCTKVCPTAALTERDGLTAALDAIDLGRRIVWQIAPSVQNMLGENFRLPAGVDVTKKIAAAMKRLGGYAFHTDFAADVTIMEEGNEFIHRLRTGGVLPMFTSCCPGWVKYAEAHFADLIPHLSTTKSPQQIFGALAKNYFPLHYPVPAADVYQISVMPCTAKKYECARPEMKDSGNRRNVDLVLTAREFCQLLERKHIDLSTIEDAEFDSLLQESTGAARIFGASGGVMEASLRAVSLLLTGHELPVVETLRTREGVKEAELTIAGITFRFAAVNGIGNIRRVMEEVRAGESPYHFIEIMACPNGCIGGGGALFQSIESPWTSTAVQKRQEGLYRADSLFKNTVCLQNEEMQILYRDFLGKPGGHKAEELLHTHYLV